MQISRSSWGEDVRAVGTFEDVDGSVVLVSQGKRWEYLETSVALEGVSFVAVILEVGRHPQYDTAILAFELVLASLMLVLSYITLEYCVAPLAAVTLVHRLGVLLQLG